MKNEQDFFVVLPVYNEEEMLSSVLKDVLKYSKRECVVVVDDGSTDNSSMIAKSFSVQCIRHEINLGKGAALKTGCDFASKRAKKIIVMDSDGQHPPHHIPKFASMLDKYDVVLGYRKRTSEMPFVSRAGNLILDAFSKLILHAEIKDSQCGFRGFNSKAYPLLRWNSTDYTVETEFLVRMIKNKLSYIQLPIETIYHNAYKGTTPLDGIKIVFNTLKFRLFD